MEITDYNRSKKAWEVIDSDGGKHHYPNKWEAENAALRMHHKPLYDLAKSTAAQYPPLKSRAWKAAVLVARGFTNFWTRNDPSILCEVNGSGGRVYEIRAKEHATGYTCTCADFADGNAPVVMNGGQPARICKHILAMQFAKATGRTDKRIFDEFGATAAPVAAGGSGQMLVEQYADGTAVSFSQQKTHARFMLKNSRSARNRDELVNWINQ